MINYLLPEWSGKFKRRHCAISIRRCDWSSNNSRYGLGDDSPETFPWSEREEELAKVLAIAFYRTVKVGKGFNLVVLAKGDLWSLKDVVPTFKKARDAKKWLCSQITGLKLVLKYKRTLPAE
jgi:hypothetical protein